MKLAVKHLLFFMIANLAGMWCIGQITPPGLGSDVKVGEWMAVGVKQDLDKYQKLQSITYVGFGRSNGFNDINPVKRPVNWVLTQELKYNPNKFLPFALGMSYRHKKIYASIDNNFTDVRQEWRLYAKLYFTKKWNRLKATLTLRPELRFFEDTAFHPWKKEDEQFRTRLKASVSRSLYEGKQVISFAVEALAATKHHIKDNPEWETYQYADTRLSLYYTFKWPSRSLQFDVGYMCDLYLNDNLNAVHYPAFDLILNNPFEKG